MRVYIISYFGDVGPQSWQRKGYHLEQLGSLLTDPRIEHITVLAQDYELYFDRYQNRPRDSLYLKHPRITYIKAPRMTPGQARNILIDEMSRTTDDWALFMDNDCIIDPRYQGTEWIPIVEYNKEQLNKMADVITPLEGKIQPFKKRLAKWQHFTETHACFIRDPRLKSTMFLLRNRRHHGDSVIHFSDTLTHLEDYDYSARVLSAGGSIYRWEQWLMLDLGCHNSLLFPDDPHNCVEQRTREWHQLKPQIVSQYPGLRIDSDLTTHWHLIDRAQHQPRWIALPRPNRPREDIRYAVSANNTFDQWFESEQRPAQLDPIDQPAQDV